MDKYLKDVESQLNLIYNMTQDDDEFGENDQHEVDKDELLLRSLIALSALREYRQRKASHDYIRDGKPTFDLDD
jgi:hypothetical protein